MKLYALAFLLAAVVFVECTHTFLGTNVLRPLVYHHSYHYRSKIFKKRIQNMNFALPPEFSSAGRSIQGILAIDLTHTTATANVTQGGLGFSFVNLRMKSAVGESIHFDVYIYA